MLFFTLCFLIIFPTFSFVVYGFLACLIITVCLLDIRYTLLIIINFYFFPWKLLFSTGFFYSTFVVSSPCGIISHRLESVKTNSNLEMICSMLVISEIPSNVKNWNVKSSLKHEQNEHHCTELLELSSIMNKHAIIRIKPEYSRT